MTAQTTIVDALKRIAEDHDGILRPRDIVEAARDEESPLHSQFDWDDSTAAEKHRLWQARQLTRVLVTFEPGVGGKMIPCRVFTSLTPDREDSGYRVTAAVMDDPAQRAQMLADAYADMRRFRLKYQHLVELAKVFEAIDDVQGSLVFKGVSMEEATADATV
jgi:hypothetical protein